MKKNFHIPEVVRRLEAIDETLLAKILATTPTDLAELSAWQKAGVLAAIDEIDAGQGIAHAEIVGLVREWKTNHTNQAV